MKSNDFYREPEISGLRMGGKKAELVLWYRDFFEKENDMGQGLNDEQQFEADVRHFLNELFISKEGIEEWDSEDFVNEQAEKLVTKLKEAGHENLVGFIEIWPEDDETTKDVNEAEQTRIQISKDLGHPVDIVFDFKGQVDFQGSYYKFVID